MADAGLVRSPCAPTPRGGKTRVGDTSNNDARTVHAYDAAGL